MTQADTHGGSDRLQRRSEAASLLFGEMRHATEGERRAYEEMLEGISVPMEGVDILGGESPCGDGGAAGREEHE